MTPQEINAWARSANESRECAGRQVLIKRADGQYLARQGAWTVDREQARIYDYTADRVAAQLMEVEMKYAALWSPEILPNQA